MLLWGKKSQQSQLDWIGKLENKDIERKLEENSFEHWLRRDWSI